MVVTSYTTAILIPAVNCFALNTILQLIVYFKLKEETEIFQIAKLPQLFEKKSFCELAMNILISTAITVFFASHYYYLKTHSNVQIAFSVLNSFGVFYSIIVKSPKEHGIFTAENDALSFQSTKYMRVAWFFIFGAIKMILDLTNST